MYSDDLIEDLEEVALLAEGVDRNAASLKGIAYTRGSPSSRRAWIEILKKAYNIIRRKVALLAEGVDRNTGHTP